MTKADNEALPGFVQRHEGWDHITAVSTIGRRTMGAIPNYRLLKAATQIDASAGARLLLVHLIGYLGIDDTEKPNSRFIVFPGNTRLSDELRCTARTIQRQADELEDKGMIRRCYNGMNRRTGFDLTPFAMQHEAITAEIVGLQTKRRQDREAAQLELSLEANRIARPTTSMSSQGDTNVTHNRTDLSNNDGRAIAEAALDAIDLKAFAGVSTHVSVEEDRTEALLEAALISISNLFSRGGRASHLGWATALQTLGWKRACALFLVAEADPRRRASPERYFGWLLRMIATSDGSMINAAAERAITSATARQPQFYMTPPTARQLGSVLGAIEAIVPNPTNVALEETRISPREKPPTNSAPGALNDAIRRELGPRLYDSWLANAQIIRKDDGITVVATSAFAASWIQSHLAGAIKAAATSLEGKPTEVRVVQAAA